MQTTPLPAAVETRRPPLPKLAGRARPLDTPQAARGETFCLSLAVALARIMAEPRHGRTL